MNRNKPPALTSPWKIGFLVSLLLVTTSIGVGVLITRTFDLSWTWIQNTNGSWTFDKNAFLKEMLPLVVLVPLVSLFSYFLIAGAVRKYKAYLDSGADYKNLLQSLEKIDDLQNEEKIKSLSNYPELRTFLLRTRNRIAEREKVLADKEKQISARMKSVTAGEEVKSELNTLISAIARGPEEGFSDELLISLPDVKRVEAAIREHLLRPQMAGTSMTNSDVAEITANLRAELQETARTLREKFEYIAAEFEASENGARELEMQLARLKEAAQTQGAPGADAAGQAQITNSLLNNMDESSRALEALGEEVKGVAINTALHAGSGQGGTTELIKLADDVRDVAAKFNGIAQNYYQVGQQVRTAVLNSSGPGDASGLAESVGSISKKIALWVERAVVLSSKLSLFKEHYLNSIAALEIKLGGPIEDDSYQTVEDFPTPASGVVEEVSERQGDDFERQSNLSPLAETPDGPAYDVAGPQAQEGRVEEAGEYGSEDGLFADIPADEPRGPAQEEASMPEAEAPPAAQPPEAGEMFEEIDAAEAGEDAPLAPPPSQSRRRTGELIQSQMNLTGSGEQETGPETEQQADGGFGLDLESHRYASPEKPPVAEPEPESSPEEEIIDLYELGAVDYQPDGVQHNV